MEELDSKYSKREDKIVVANTYLITKFLKRFDHFNRYEGIDLESRKPVCLIVTSVRMEQLRKKLIKSTSIRRVCMPNWWSRVHR